MNKSQEKSFETRKLSDYEKAIIETLPGTKLSCPHCGFRMDPKLRFCKEGLYKSLDNVDAIKVGCFDDGANNVELGAPNANVRNELKLNIA